MNSCRRPWFCLLIALTQISLSSFLVAQNGTPAGGPANLQGKGEAPVRGADGRIVLRGGWTLETSAKVDAKGEVIATPQFSPTGWHEVTVPTTVVAALVKEKALPDPFFAMNLRSYPGVNYPIGQNFSNIAMAPDSPYAVSWWYRKAFTVPASYKAKTIWLKFNGINYRANIWLNGKQIATSDDLSLIHI